MSIVSINESNFNQTVIANEGTVVLDFYADWCVPCKMLLPVLQKIADDNPDVAFGKINVDENPTLAQAFHIQSIPTIVIVEKGIVKETLVGLRDRSEIEELIK